MPSPGEAQAVSLPGLEPWLHRSLTVRPAVRELPSLGLSILTCQLGLVAVLTWQW